MILSQIINERYSYSLEKLENVKGTKEKRKIVKELIGNLKNSSIPFSLRELSKILKVGRPLVTSIKREFDSDFIKIENKETRGRKRYEDKHKEVLDHIKEIVEKTENIDSSLQDEIIYIDPTLNNIREKLMNEYGYTKPPCPSTISKILKEKLGYKITKIKKSKVFKKIPETDAIFENVNKKFEEIKNSNGCIKGISIDDKTSKYIGNLNDGGKSWKNKEANDHDTNPDAIVKPFGIMDVETKKTSVYCTTSNSTAEFKVNCLQEYIIVLLSIFPALKKIIIFLDNGPENSSRRKLWMYNIIKLSIELNITIELVYYPPYHSKYNKIEHFWGVLQRTWSKLIINSFDKLIGAINGTKYNKINAKGYLREELYEKGKKVNENELKKLIKEHVHYENEGIEKWSLVITP